MLIPEVSAVAMTFDYSSLAASASFWDSVSIWLALAVAIGVSMEAVSEFDTLAGWLRLDRQQTFALRHGIAKTGLLILIVALACEVWAAVETHRINKDIDAGLNNEIRLTQDREQKLIDETANLSARNKELEGIVSKQEGTLGSLSTRADAFDSTANKLRTRMESSLAVLNHAQQDAIASAGKAAVALDAANKTAAAMEDTLNAEKSMQEGMRELITPRVMTPEQSASLTESARPYKGTRFTFYVTDDPDAKALYGQLASALEHAGWVWSPAAQVGVLSFTVPGKPQVPLFTTTGLQFSIAQSSLPTLEKPVLAVVSALASFGIRGTANATPDEKIDAKFDRTIIHIFVGKR